MKLPVEWRVAHSFRPPSALSEERFAEGCFFIHIRRAFADPCGVFLFSSLANVFVVAVDPRIFTVFFSESLLDPCLVVRTIFFSLYRELQS